MGSASLLGLPDAAASRFIVYAGPDTHIVSGSIGDNVVAGLRRREPKLEASRIAAELQRRVESVRSGNPAILPNDDWIDLELAGVGSMDELMHRVCDLLRARGSATTCSASASCRRSTPRTTAS